MLGRPETIYEPRPRSIAKGRYLALVIGSNEHDYVVMDEQEKPTSEEPLKKLKDAYLRKPPAGLYHHIRAR